MLRAASTAESAAHDRGEPVLNVTLPAPGVDELAHSAALVTLIRGEIAAHGPLPFARYMELCLYAPGLGYYSAGRTKFGAAGDFVTAPELGHLFARTIARTLAPTLQTLGADADIVELGGGSGAFAIDALREWATLGVVPQRYRVLETSADLAQRQRALVSAQLPPALADRVEWIAEPPPSPWHGVLFANEVVDALPATRFAIRGSAVFEEHVTWEDGHLARVDRAADAFVTTAVRQLEQTLDAPFADGYRSEILPQLSSWIEAVSASLSSGVALFVDYGYPRREFYLPQRSDGTLVCHYRHRAHADPFHWPGLADLTAFVDFTALAEAGVAQGFAFVGYAPQGAFLLASGLAALIEEAGDLDDLQRLRIVAEAKRLTLPGDMGERFQAIAFVRGLDDPLPGLRAADFSRRL